jgi:hypothetical protein
MGLKIFATLPYFLFRLPVSSDDPLQERIS